MASARPQEDSSKGFHWIGFVCDGANGGVAGRWLSSVPSQAQATQKATGPDSTDPNGGYRKPRPFPWPLLSKSPDSRL